MNMGEYLKLITKKEIDETKVKEIIKEYFKDYPRLIIDLWISPNGSISTKLATCEEVFFSFDEMIKIYLFIEEKKDIFQYGEEQSFSWIPEQFLKDRKSLYKGTFSIWNDNKNISKVKIKKYVKSLDHYKVWRKTIKTISKSGKTYWKRVPKYETSGCIGNPNGISLDCPNKNKSFNAFKSGFAWNVKTNKGRRLYTCPLCSATFNQGEFKTPQYKWLQEKLLKSDKHEL